MTVEYKNETYNVETIHVYDEYISIYKGNLLETESIDVKLSEVKNLSLSGVVKSFTAEDVINALDDCFNLDQAIRFFESKK